MTRLKLPNLHTTIYISLLAFMSITAHANPPLSAERIQSWIQSQQAFANWGDRHAERLAEYQGAHMNEANPLAIDASEMIRPLKETGLQASAEKMLQPFGFDSLEEWAELTLRITKSAAALQVDQQKDSLDTSKLEALAESGKLSKEQEDMVSRAINQNQQMLNYLEQSVSEEDKAAVRPYLNQLQDLLE